MRDNGPSFPLSLFGENMEGPDFEYRCVLAIMRSRRAVLLAQIAECNAEIDLIDHHLTEAERLEALAIEAEQGLNQSEKRVSVRRGAARSQETEGVKP